MYENMGIIFRKLRREGDYFILMSQGMLCNLISLSWGELSVGNIGQKAVMLLKIH